MRTKTTHTLETLMKRTEEVGDCIEWQGYFQNKNPYVQHGDRFMSVRALVMELLGHQYEGKIFYGTKCDNKRCVNPEHIVARTPKQHISYMSSRVDPNAPMRVFKLQKAAAKRRALDDEQLMQVRTDNRTCGEIAASLGVSKSLVSKIRRNKSYRMVNAQNNPFWGLMA